MWSVLPLVGLLIVFPALYFTCTTWFNGMTARHADAAVLRRWKQNMYDSIGAFQLTVSAALLIFDIGYGDVSMWFSSGIALALFGVALIWWPRTKIGRWLSDPLPQGEDDAGQRDGRQGAAAADPQRQP